MYRAFADAEFFSGVADCSPVFYDVLGERTGPFLDVPFQEATLPASCCLNLCKTAGRYAGSAGDGAAYRRRDGDIRRMLGENMNNA